jgi:hypothetical protein
VDELRVTLEQEDELPIVVKSGTFVAGAAPHLTSAQAASDILNDVHSLSAHLSKTAAACPLLAACVFAVACGRVAVDTEGSREPASVATAAAEATVVPTAISIAELHQRRDLAAGQVVSIQGVLKEFNVCQDCPKDAACAPCADDFELGTQMDAPAEPTVLFINSRSSMDAYVFHVGQRYVFSGTLREWRDPGAAYTNFLNLDYVSHRSLD